MRHIAFLYKSDEPGSALLCRALIELTRPLDVDLWWDGRATDAGFVREMSEVLKTTDVVIHCIGPKGPGFYQSLVEIDKTVDAMTARPMLRLIIVLLGNTREPDELSRLRIFGDRTTVLPLDPETPNAMQVLTLAEPNVLQVQANPVAKQAMDILKATVTNVVRRSLTLVIGPYAFAESNVRELTPALTIRKLLRNKSLPGFLPWLDVMGSIARATVNDEPTSAADIASVVSGDPGQLGVYLRLLAANWARTPGKQRLFIVACEPNLRTDLELRRSSMPIPHVRLVNQPRAGKTYAERFSIENFESKRDAIEDSNAKLGDKDRVVLIKPLGCLEDDHRMQALLTAEHWRSSSNVEMVLPSGIANEMAQSCLVILGAGVFTPSLQIVFSSLLPSALKNLDGSSNRFLLHDPLSNVPDPLHRVESALLRSTDADQKESVSDWLRKTYDVKGRLVPPQSVLAWLHKLLEAHQAEGTLHR